MAWPLVASCLFRLGWSYNAEIRCFGGQKVPPLKSRSRLTFWASSCFPLGLVITWDIHTNWVQPVFLLLLPFSLVLSPVRSYLRKASVSPGWSPKIIILEWNTTKLRYCQIFPNNNLPPGTSTNSKLLKTVHAYRNIELKDRRARRYWGLKTLYMRTCETNPLSGTGNV